MTDSRAQTQIVTAEGWEARRLTPQSRLHGANGLRTGADGRLYVAQVAGSQISAIDPDSGAIETICPFGGRIVAPDDLVFDDHGNLYITELTEGRVSVREPNGTIRTVYGEMDVANPIAFHNGRLIAGECRPGGRIMELDLNGGAPRMILDDVPMPNAFAVGPDGLLYVPIMGTNEIWRVSLDGGAPEVVAGDLGVPDAVKFDSKGRIVSTQVASGQVLRLDLQSGAREVLAQLNPGLDNCDFVGERLFVSNIAGSVHEIMSSGEARPLVGRGLQWPMGLAYGADGTLYVADGAFSYALAPGGTLQEQGFLFTPGYPGFNRGVAAGAAPGEWIVTTGNGGVFRFCPARSESEELAVGFDRLMGVACAASGAVVFAEYGTGRVHSAEGGTSEVLVEGLDRPAGVAIAGDGTVFIAESGAGRIVKLSGGRAETVIDGLKRPEGLAVNGGQLFVLDVGAQELIACDLDGSGRQVLAADLPVGTAQGLARTQLGPVGILAGPMTSFSGIAVASDGTIAIAGDAEGSVIALRRTTG